MLDASGGLGEKGVFKKDNMEVAKDAGCNVPIDKRCRNSGVKDIQRTAETSTGSLVMRGRCEGGRFKIKPTKVFMFAQVGLKLSERRRGETEGRTAAKRIGGGPENNRSEVQDGRSRSATEHALLSLQSNALNVLWLQLLQKRETHLFDVNVCESRRLI